MRSGLLLIALALITLAGCAKDPEPYDYTLSGTIRYADRLYDANGFQTNTDGSPATQLLPVRNTQLELVEEVGGAILGKTSTDTNGAYTLSARSAGQVYLRILAATDPNQAPPVEVHDDAGVQIAATYHFTPAKGASTVDVTVPVTGDTSGAFNILDVLTYAGQFYESLNNTPPGLLKAYWSPSNTNGTGYCPYQDLGSCRLGKGIYVCGACTSLASSTPDSDQYDDDVLLHEYGHFVEDSFGTIDSLGGPHSLWQTNLDLRLAWSEGWGDFFSGAAKTWINTATAGKAISEQPAASSLYVDTLGNGIGIAYDFATAPSYQGVVPVYDSSEVAVAKVLHDLLAADTMQPIWGIETGDFATTGVLSTMESFADDWALHSYSSTDLATALNGRQIGFAEDAYEPNNDIAHATALTVGTPVAATLYSTTVNPDVDYYWFSATANTTYTIDTCKLWNAADTQIRIIDTDQTTVLMSNDNYDLGIWYVAPGSANDSTVNKNDGTTLHSSVSFAAPASATYYVEVTHSSLAPSWAGRYGNYTLSVAAGSTACN